MGRIFDSRVLLNCPPPPDNAEITEIQDTLINVNAAKSSKEEIEKAIKSKRVANLRGRQDGIPAEILKEDFSTSTQMLYEIYEKIWEDESIPEDRKEGHLVKNPVKGSPCFKFPEKMLNRIISGAIDKILKPVKLN